MEKGPELVLQTVEGLIAGTLTPTPQNEALALHKAPKLTPENTRINWNVPAQQVYNTIRGLWHFPVAWTTLDAQRVKLPYPCSFRQEDPFASPGEFRLTNTGELEVAVADGVVCLPEIQMAGKRQMPCQDLFRGYTPQQYRFE
jgi:methionyl-tRNA formyltransferase